MRMFLYLTLKNIKTLSIACIYANTLILLFAIIFIIVKILSEQSEINIYLIYEVISHVITNVFSIDFIKKFLITYKDKLIGIILFIPSAAVIAAFIQRMEHLD